ncbi:MULTISPECIES: fimbrillin family protein [Butyricimonas]|uniref:fimbrillin family protein n=1 Tax=Butyricimonas TaxID=574697 RepID=UPI0007FB3F42|nr:MULTISPECIES: fimbrillin family protein [Butyricimonas]
MRTLVFILLATVLLSCIRNVSEENVDEQKIRFRSNIQKLKSGNLSRVDGFNDGDKVILYIAERENAEEVEAPAPGDYCEMTYTNDGSLVFKEGEERNYPDMPVDVYGYYWTGQHTEPTGLSSMAVHVETDQSGGVDGSDFLYVRAAEGFAKNAEPINLEFEHLFSKIVLNITTETPSTIDLERLGNVKLHNVVTAGTLDLGSGESIGGDVKDEVVMPNVANSVAIVLPQEIEAGKKLFSFQVGDIEEPFEVNVSSNGFEKGKEYTYNVEVNKYPGMGPVDMQFSLSVKEWEAGNVNDVVIEKGEEVEVMLVDVAQGVNINKAELYLFVGDVKRELKNIVVVDNKMKFVFPRLVEGGSLQLEKAIFYTDNEESFEYYFEDKVLLGNNYDQIALPAPKVGDAWAGGTIFLVGKVTGYDKVKGEFKTDEKGINIYRGRVVANKTLGQLSWGDVRSKGRTVIVGAKDTINGAVNMEIVKAFVEDKGESWSLYPSFQACLDLGKGWYYPAIKEIETIKKYRVDINVNIANKSGDLISDELVYGSSTERGTSRVTDYRGTGEFIDKDSPAEVRAVRAY